MLATWRDAPPIGGFPRATKSNVEATKSPSETFLKCFLGIVLTFRELPSWQLTAQVATQETGQGVIPRG
jgi:hypothetical protein